MAENFNNNNKNGGHANLSVPMTTFWSTDSSGNEYQSVKIGIYGEKITLNFTKGLKGNKEQPPVTAHIMMDYESACIVGNVLKGIMDYRKNCFKQHVPYPVGSFKNTLQITEKESKTVRTIGVFEIKTEVSEASGNNTVYICYNTGADQFKVGLGSVYLKSQCEFDGEVPVAEEIDLNDSRFYAFVSQFFSVLYNYPSLMTQEKVLSVMMGNFGAIRYKLGIPAKTNNGNGGNGRYTDSNYRSPSNSAPSNNNDYESDSDFGDAPF